MTTIPLLRQRARPLTPDELAAVPWLPALTPGEREKACDDLIVTETLVGETICRIGKPANYWFGLVDGLLKMSNDDSLGPVITFTGVAPVAGLARAQCSSERFTATTSRRCEKAGWPGCRLTVSIG